MTHTFAFIAGCLAFDFVDTFGSRSSGGREHLHAPSDLADWMQAAGLTRQVQADAHDLSEALALREAIHRSAMRAIDDIAPASRDVVRINAAARKPPLRPQLVRGELERVADRPVEAALSVIAEDALRVLGVPLRTRIRRCPDCAMVFLDTSPPGRRRWCSSAAGCGNRAKVRNLRARRAFPSKEA